MKPPPKRHVLYLLNNRQPTRWSRVLAFLSAVFVLFTACDEPQEPLKPLPKVDGSARAVLDAALEHSPVHLAHQAIIGVLDADQTPNERTVVYITHEVVAEYRFVWEAGWRPARLLFRRDRSQTDPASVSRAPTSYTDSVATVWEWTGYPGGTHVKDHLYARLDDWTYITESGNYTGWVWDTGSGSDSSLTRGEAYPATKTISDTIFDIPQDSLRWSYWLKNDPYQENSCPKGWTSCTFSDLSLKTALDMYMRVVAPVSVTITSGPTHIEFQGSYTWKASGNGGDVKDAITYQWHYSEDNANWVLKGSGSSLALQLTDEEQPPFWLRITAESGGRNASDTRHITVASPLLEAFSVYIDGPDELYLHEYGDFTAITSGGTTPYSYEWRTRDRQMADGQWQAWSSWYSDDNTISTAVHRCGIDSKELAVRATDGDSHMAGHRHQFWIRDPDPC